MLALLALDRGPRITTGFHEPHRDQPDRLARDTQPLRDDHPLIDGPGPEVQCEQHPRTTDQRDRLNPATGHPLQRFTILRRQHHRVLLL